MSRLDFTKLTDAVAAVAALAASHADVSAQVSEALAAQSAALAARDAALAAAQAAHDELTQAQVDIDAMAAKLIGAATTPAEAAGLAAVAEAISVAPAPAFASVTFPEIPVAPIGTFLPGDPRATA